MATNDRVHWNEQRCGRCEHKYLKRLKSDRMEYTMAARREEKQSRNEPIEWATKLRVLRLRGKSFFLFAFQVFRANECARIELRKMLALLLLLLLCNWTNVSLIVLCSRSRMIFSFFNFISFFAASPSGYSSSFFISFSHLILTPRQYSCLEFEMQSTDFFSAFTNRTQNRTDQF